MVDGWSGYKLQKGYNSEKYTTKFIVKVNQTNLSVPIFVIFNLKDQDFYLKTSNNSVVKNLTYVVLISFSELVT
jgi:hypothetical protein